MAFLNETGLEQVWGKIKTKVNSIENTISDIDKAKVDKVSGKGLSTNDYTTDEKNKLAGITTGATKVIVDSALSNTSTNAIQNKVVTNMKTNIDDELSNKPSKTGDGASGTWGIDITGSSNKISYSTQLTTDDAINAFNTGSTFQVSTWYDTSFPGVSNGIIINAGWTSADYGVQIAIDDDPTYYIALRQKDTSGWNAWKRIPMGDGTGASGTWDIDITGNAATATKATQDEKGNAISSTYLKLSGGTINGLFKVRNSSNHPALSLDSSSYHGNQSQIYYSIPSSSATANFGFREYSRSSSDYTLLSYCEDFVLPSVSSDRTYNSTYHILTSKFTVTVAQGGTGAASKSGARTNLGITSGTSLPSASGHSAGDIFILY